MKKTFTSITNKEELSHNVGKPILFCENLTDMEQKFDIELFIQEATAPINAVGYWSKQSTSPNEVFYSISKNFTPQRIEGDFHNGLLMAPLFFFPEFHPELLDHLDETIISKGKLIPLPRYKDTSPYRKALFLDRDGVINKDTGYVDSPDDIILVEGITTLIKEAHEKNYLVIVVTNQSGVARGFYQEKDIHAVHKKIDELLGQHDVAVNDYYYSLRLPGQVAGPLGQQTLLRKPLPGMVLRACEDHHIDLKNSLMVGDKLSDSLYLPGLKTILFQGNYDLSEANDPVVNSLSEIVPRL